MSNIKQLTLNEINDEVLDECFENENEKFEILITNYEEGMETVVDDIKSQSQLNKIKRSAQVLSNEELVYNVQNGIDVQENKTLLVEYNSGLVYNEAKKCTCNISFDDKVQYGFVALLDAINTFDTNYASRFSTYATTVIKQQLYRFGNREVRPIEIPEYLSKHNIQVQNFITSYTVSNGISPSEDVIAAGTGIDVRSVRKILNYSPNMYSIETPVTSDGNLLLQDIITSSNKDYILNEESISPTFSEAMQLVLDKLDEHDRVLIGLIHGLDGYKVSTFDEIIDGGYIDFTGEFVQSKATLSRRYQTAISKVKKVIQDNKIDILGNI